MSGKKNQAFLDATDKKTRAEVLNQISVRYSITPREALAEVIDPDAEHLCEYLSEPTRRAVSLLMKRHGVER